jgi:hypothetical protein
MPLGPRPSRRRNPAPQTLDVDTAYSARYRSIPSDAICVYQLRVLLRSGFGSLQHKSDLDYRSTIKTNLGFHPESKRRLAMRRDRQINHGYP